MSYQLQKCEDGLVYVLYADKVYRIDQTMDYLTYIHNLKEERAEYTKARQWWHDNVESRDMPDSKASRADYSDGGASVRNMVRMIDWKPKTTKTLPCIIAKRNCCRIARRLMINNWHRVGDFVAAVWKNGNKGREETMAAFGLSDQVYRRRLQLYAAILGYGHIPNLHTSGSC